MIKGYTIICNQCNERITIKHVEDMDKQNIKVQSTMQGDVYIYCEQCDDNTTSIEI